MHGPLPSPMLAAALRASTDDPEVAPLPQRNDEAILATWRRFAPLIQRTLVRLLGPDEEVNDLAQEAFLQLYRSVSALRSPKALRPFVDGIAVHLAVHELRRRRVRQTQVLLPGQGPLPERSFSADPEARETMAGLLEVVGRLRPGDQEIFVLWQIEGLEQTDIAAVTGLSISTVRRRVRRIRRRVGTLVRGDARLAAYAERASGQLWGRA